MPDEIPGLDRLDAEHDNLRVALSWALTHQQTELAMRASGGLFRFWERRGSFQEGSAWLEQTLARADQSPTQYRGRALNALATLYWRGAEVDRAEAVAEQAPRSTERSRALPVRRRRSSAWTRNCQYCLFGAARSRLLSGILPAAEGPVQLTEDDLLAGCVLLLPA